MDRLPTIFSGITLVGMFGLVFRAGQIVQELRDLKEKVSRIDVYGCSASHKQTCGDD